MLPGRSGTDQALGAVGDILQAEGHAAAIVIVGGAALNLSGVADRATRVAAARWVKTQDTSPHFPDIVDQVVAHAKADTA
jgi:hypothetical protein